MQNIKLEHGSMEMWLTVVAIGNEHHLIDEMKTNEDGTRTIIFSVGGVELDFSKVANRIEKEIDFLVQEKVKEKEITVNKKMVNDLIESIKFNIEKEE